MKKIKVEICVGTTCHILGASELQDIEEFIPEELKDSVEISGVPCLGACKNNNFGSAPFVRINGRIVGGANIHFLIEEIVKEGAGR